MDEKDIRQIESSLFNNPVQQTVLSFVAPTLNNDTQAGIQNPVNGLIMHNSDSGKLEYVAGDTWYSIPRTADIVDLINYYVGQALICTEHTPGALQNSYTGTMKWYVWEGLGIGLIDAIVFPGTMGTTIANIGTHRPAVESYCMGSSNIALVPIVVTLTTGGDLSASGETGGATRFWMWYRI